MLLTQTTYILAVIVPNKLLKQISSSTSISLSKFNGIFKIFRPICLEHRRLLYFCFRLFGHYNEQFYRCSSMAREGFAAVFPDMACDSDG